MRFETSIDIAAPQQRVWDVLTDLVAWPRRIETVEAVELMTAGPIAVGSRVRLKQLKLPEGIWDVTAWDAPTWFQWRQKASGVTSVAGHRVTTLSDDRSVLSLSLDMRGLLVPLVGRLSKGMIDRYMATEAQSIKHAAELPVANPPGAPERRAPSGPALGGPRGDATPATAVYGRGSVPAVTCHCETGPDA